MQLTHSQIMQVTHEQIKLVGCERKQWEHFKDFHYQTLPLSTQAQCHLAVLELNGVKTVIGFCAAMTQWGRYDEPDENERHRSAWKAHKTVVRMPESPEMFHLWALVSDKQAQHYVELGVLFYSRAPILYAAYRDNPDSNWVATCKDADAIKLHEERSHQYKWVASGSDPENKKKGYRSHQFKEMGMSTQNPFAESGSSPGVAQVNSPSRVGDSRMRIVPLHLRQANELVARLHRHHQPIRVAKFSIGCEVGGILIGAAICMRPACRSLDDGTTVEVCRLVTDGTANACSMLYGACKRIARDMGYAKIQTYILDSEPGTSLRGAGWVLEKTGCGGSPQGERTNRPNGHEETDVTRVTKQRWAATIMEASI